MNQDAIGQTITSSTAFWPLMTDGPATQSAFIENIKLLPIFTQNVLYASGIQSQLRVQFAEEGLPIEVVTLLLD